MQPKNGKPATERRFTIEDAFSFYYEPHGIDYNELNLRRTVLSVAFLLDSLSDGGNEPVNSLVANGLAAALKQCAAETGYIRPTYRGALALRKSGRRNGR